MRATRSLSVLAGPVLAVLLAGCGHFSVRPASETFEPAECAPARLTLPGALAVAQVEGTPEEMGAQLGALAGEPAASLLSSWRFAEFFRALLQTSCSSEEELVKVVPESYRRELERLSAIAGIDSGALLRANAVVDACMCTAFVASGSATGGAPLLVGRNMDFAPANVLGASTLVTVYRPAAAHAFVSVGFPGFAAVASGMNDAGLVALILINSTAKPRGPGIPLGFVVRRLLERCTSVAEARALFHESPPASGHFIFLADARTAAVVSRDTEDRLLEDELLVCTNGPVDPKALVQTDARSRCAWDLLLETRGSIDVETVRSILAATHLRHENTHAMAFEPATRTLWLARGTTFAPAALGHWDKLELRAAFEGGPVTATPLPPPCDRFPHWTDLDYRGLLVERRLAASSPRRER